MNKVLHLMDTLVKHSGGGDMEVNDAKISDMVSAHRVFVGTACFIYNKNVWYILSMIKL